MAQPGTTPIAAPIDTTAIGDSYPTHFAHRGKGSLRTVLNDTERAAIATLRKEQGMMVWNVAANAFQKLEPDLTSWTTLSGMTFNPALYLDKATYDPNNDGSVVNSDALQGSNLATVLARANHTGVQAIATVTGLQAALDAKEDEANKGVANGYVPLGPGATIDPIYLGITLSTPLEGWNANTNTPTLADGTGNANEYCFVTVAGTSDLGSGNLVCAIGNFIYHDGTKWNLVTTTGFGVSSVTTNLGLQTGAVTLNNTSYLVDSAGKRFVTDNIQAGLNASTFPITAANPAVSKAEISSLIVVGNGVFMAELFSNGHTLGDGTLRMLSTLTNPATGVAYTNVSAGNYWTRVNSAYTINVNTMSIDWIARQEAYLAMSQDGYSKIISPGGRGYCPSQTWDLPRTQEAVSLYRRGYKFIFDDQGSVTYNRTGTNMILYKRMPVDQTEAQGVFLDYGFFFQNMFLYGNQTNNASNIGIQLGASTHSRFDNVETNSFNQAVDIQFALELSMKNIKHVNYFTHGSKIGKGTWSGATSATAGVNMVDIVQHRCYNGSGRTPVAGLYFYGCPGNVVADTLTFEGFNGAQQHIFYDNDASDGIAGAESALSLSNLYFETAGASRAAIRFKSAKGDFFVNKWSNIVSLANLPVLIEAEQPAGLGGVRQLYVSVAGYATGQITPKFRATCPYSRVANGSIFESGYCSYFDVSRVNMPNGAGTFNNTTNFDNSLPNYVIPMSNQFTFLPSPI